MPATVVLVPDIRDLPFIVSVAKTLISGLADYILVDETVATEFDAQAALVGATQNVIIFVNETILGWVYKIFRSPDKYRGFFILPGMTRFNDVLFAQSENDPADYNISVQLSTHLTTIVPMIQKLDLYDRRYGVDALCRVFQSIFGISNPHEDMENYLKCLWGDERSRQWEIYGRGPQEAPAPPRWTSPLPSEWPVNATGLGRIFLGSGWSSLETRHVWSIGRRSVVFIPKSHMPFGAMRCRLKGFRAGHDCAITVLVDSRELLHQQLTSGSPGNVDLVLDLNIVDSLRDFFTIEILYSETFSPKRANLGGDARELAFALTSIILEPTPEHSVTPLATVERLGVAHHPPSNVREEAMAALSVCAARNAITMIPTDEFERVGSTWAETIDPAALRRVDRRRVIFAVADASSSGATRLDLWHLCRSHGVKSVVFLSNVDDQAHEAGRGERSVECQPLMATMPALLQTIDEAKCLPDLVIAPTVDKAITITHQISAVAPLGWQPVLMLVTSADIDGIHKYGKYFSQMIGRFTIFDNYLVMHCN